MNLLFGFSNYRFCDICRQIKHKNSILISILFFKKEKNRSRTSKSTWQSKSSRFKIQLDQIIVVSHLKCDQLSIVLKVFKSIDNFLTIKV